MTAAVGQVPGSLIDWAAGIIGVSPKVVAAQINEESGGNPGALSPTGAQGVAQFEPGTWQGQGCTGSPWDVNSAMKCYAVFMHQLVKQYHGNVRDALAAYNAGPGNIQAGYGYADTILANAGQPQTVTASASTGNVSNPPASGGSSCLIGPLPHTSFCLLDKSQARAAIGGLMMTAGALIVLPGVIILVAAGFRASGAGQAVQGAARTAGKIPGYGRAFRAVAG